MSDKTLACVVFIVTAACLSLLLVIGPAGASQTSEDRSIPAYTVKPVCVSPDKRDADCGLVRRYSSGPVLNEGLATQRYIAHELGARVVYLGWTAQTRMSSHGRYLVVESGLRDDRLHVYRVVR